MARVSFVSPLPPAETGIASYAAAVLEGLERTGATERHQIESVWPIDARSVLPVRAADVGVFQLGNNVDFHGGIYELAVWKPGVVVLHDLALDGLVLALGDLTDSARREAIAAAPQGRDPDDPLAIPWCAQAVRRARVVIVHSEYARDYLDTIGCRTPVLVAPHPLVESAEAIEAAVTRGRALRGTLRGADVVVGIAGDLNEAKGIEAVLEAMRSLPKTVRLVLVGRVLPHVDMRAVVAASEVADRVTVVPNASDEDFLAWMTAVDVLLNLRHPHRGETSGSLIRALQAGVPTIVSAVGTYLEFPDDVVVRVPAGPPDAEAIAAAVRHLVDDRDARVALGERARAWAATALDATVTAEVYERAIDLAVALQRDPARVALAHWAEVLQEVGMVPRLARRGLGTAFAEALREFTPPRPPNAPVG